MMEQLTLRPRSQQLNHVTFIRLNLTSDQSQSCHRTPPRSVLVWVTLIWVLVASVEKNISDLYRR